MTSLDHAASPRGAAPSASARHIRVFSKAMAALCVATSIILAVGLVVYWMASPTEVIFRDTQLPGVAVWELGWASDARRC